jgi:NAD(P)-dependent dehydrogenase (short-subunit alcohol dehydrogenase family)
VSGRLAGRIALITGASRGIGAAVAGRLAAEGAHLVLAARTVGGLEEVDDKIRAAGGSATLVPFDLREFGKIDELAATLYERYGRLDILVGNAAEFGVFSPAGHIDPRLWGEIIDLNLTANWRLIRAMDPLLRAAPAGRAIFVTSRLARDALPYYGPYAVAKAGLETLVRIYAGEVARTAVRANLLGHRAHPVARPDLPGRGPGTVAAAGQHRQRVSRTGRAGMREKRRDRQHFRRVDYTVIPMH